MSYTTLDLLNSIARKSFLPTGQTTFTNAEMLAIADEQTLDTIIPELLAVREEYLVYHTDYSITANQNAYNIPARAIGMQVRDVAIVSGDTINPSLPRIEPEEVTSAATGSPTAFYLKNNQIILYPTPSTTINSLRVYYFLRPSELVETTDAAVISAIDTNTNTVSVSSIPSSWVSGDSFDLIKQDGAQEPLAVDQESTTVSGTDIIFSTLPTGLRVGDYVALAGETPLVQLPVELRSTLAQATATEMLEASNQPGAERAAKKLRVRLDTFKKLVTPRVQGADRVIINTSWNI